MDSVKKIKNIKIKHLKLTYDPINDTLIYDRFLLDGQYSKIVKFLIIKKMI